MRYTFYLLILFSLISCNSDDDQVEETFNPCENAMQIDAVSINDIELSIEEIGDNYYYIINAAIINNTGETVLGEPMLVVNIFGDLIPLRDFVQCTHLIANDTCFYEFKAMVSDGADIDLEFSVECFYYQLD